MASPSNKDPRREAAYMIGQILHGENSAYQRLSTTFQKETWSPRDRALLTDIVYGVMQHLYELDHALEQVAKKGFQSIDTAIINQLRVAVFQLHHLDNIVGHAVISQAVQSIQKRRGERVGGFALALLQKLQKAPASLLRVGECDSLAERLSKLHSYPQWIVERWLERLGQKRTRSRLESFNETCPLTFRYHGPRHQRDDVVAMLAAEGITVEPTVWSPDGLRFIGTFEESMYFSFRSLSYLLVPQDEATQLMVHWLEPQRDEKILYACAAPDGATTHIHALAPEAKVTACDVDPLQLERLEKLCRRLHVPTTKGETPHYKLVEQEASKPFKTKFDRILCNAPCSELGLLRKQPETRYRQSPETLQEMARNQKNLLHHLARSLKPGGLMLYSVCTDTVEECEEVVASFLERNPEFCLDTDLPSTLPGYDLMSEEGFLQTSPEIHDMDAIFVARLRKKGSVGS